MKFDANNIDMQNINGLRKIFFDKQSINFFPDIKNIRSIFSVL